MHKKSVIWGTGTLAENFVESIDPSQIVAFVDPQKTGTFMGKPILAPNGLAKQEYDSLIVCSSFVDEIVPKLGELNINIAKVFVFKNSFHQPVSLSEFLTLKNGRLYHLPWQSQLEQVHSCLSIDMVFPEVYKELAKSIGYCFIASVEGDFAEFGTATGYSSSLIAYVVDYYSKHMSKHEQSHGQQLRSFHLFDSFEGFPKSIAAPDLDSPHVSSGTWKEGGAKGLSADELANLCSNFLDVSRINVFEGWFKDTLSSIPSNARFALVHLDCDLYESTYDVLFYLFENHHFSEGATVLFDDWFCNKASDRFGQQKAWSEVLEKFDVKYTNLGMYGCVSNKVIIHQYTKRA